MDGDEVTQRVKLWEPSPERVAVSELRRFQDWVAERHGPRTETYQEIWRWSVDDIDRFWDSVWEYFNVLGQRNDAPVRQGETMPGVRWYPGAQVNYAENLLRWAAERPEAEALVGLHEDDRREALTWGQLVGQVGALAAHLRRLGVQPGDRVCAVLPNIPQAVVALLAAAAVGAIWSVVNTDFGIKGIRDRFEQIEPTVLITVDGYQFNGKHYHQLTALPELLQALPTVQHHILVANDAAPGTTVPGNLPVPSSGFDQIVAQPQQPDFEPVEFSHPLWVLYSSGTTGKPKGIVHSHGGVVLESLRANGLQYDVRPGDRVYFTAATTWVMWNIMVDAMFCGATVITYDGAPAYGAPDKQLAICAQEGVSYFGTGAAVLTMIQKSGLSPGQRHDLSALRFVFCSGSPLPDAGWEWMYREVHPDFRLGSESGGTDVASAFVGSNPFDTVYRGELMGPYLGVAADTFNEAGEPVAGEVGELVITKPLPSMPLYLWNDPELVRFKEAYFDVFEGVWCHGDWATQLPGGSLIIHGRSDSTINRGGIRMGSADICQVVDETPGVQASMVLGVELADGGYYMPLFVVPQPNRTLDEQLQAAIIQRIRTELSPRYVPDAIVQAPDLPRTRTGKLMEVPIKKVFQGKDPATVDREAAADPGTLEWFLYYAQDFSHCQDSAV
ncbi:acetoacetate--CoA ligase [Nesterenkonia ebinurensis]|uniref:acetoacetate--CoA ligase n=1 Tax=Nesterenkonia ebinurensis TaxID=2608252 RepID=UPI00123CB91E|nr:acetoacetate--CoA ligase [Nesterenkonia ebinurensis]